MKKKNTNNKNKAKANFKIPCIILSCVVVVLAGALVYCGMNMKSEEDKEYLALQDHLLNRHIEMMYGINHNVCQMESHSLSRDHEVAVRFWCQRYDAETHQPTERKQYHTLYFQHPRELDGFMTSYAEALGD